VGPDTPFCSVFHKFSTCIQQGWTSTKQGYRAVLFPISENTKKSIVLIAGAGGRLRGSKSTWRRYFYTSRREQLLKNSVLVRMGAENKLK